MWVSRLLISFAVLISTYGVVAIDIKKGLEGLDGGLDGVLDSFDLWYGPQEESLAGLLSRPSDVGLNPFAEDQCPPCFNCLLPSFECKQFAKCNEFNGRCDCPPGFGTDDCSQPVCGGLNNGTNRPVRPGDSCECNKGWSGINCNMCTDDQACDAFLPEGIEGTCYKGGILVNKNHQMCDVTNRKILDILAGKAPQVTFSCNSTSGDCNFQFWVDQRESFYCGLDECVFDHEFKQDTNITKYNCPTVSCKCIPDRMLCGEKGSIDISDFLTETIRGPGSFECDSKSRQCIFSEPSMNDLIKSVFGDPYITLKCDSSECLHQTQLPGYHPPIKEVDKKLLIGAIAGAVVVLLAGGFVLNYFIKLSSQDKQLGYTALPTEDSTAKLMAGHMPALLQFEGLSYYDNGKQILEGVSGAASPGQVLAIMGGSGAGKTTLLDILARKTKRGVVQGSIYVNGRTFSDKHYRQVIGFVDQEDFMMPTLTVYETVVTSALLRLPKSMSVDAKKLRALETMNELGILQIKDQIIGSESNRGISGGEKRRVSIACELVTSPSILFLDEPTSGLDSYNAYNVVESLVTLAKSYNRTVVFTIHQPRSNIVALFDKLILLAQGKLVFSGNQASVPRYFSEIGYPCPAGFNVADYLIDLTMANNTSSPGEDQEEAVASGGDDTRGNSTPDIHNALPRTGTIDPTNEWLHYASHRDEARGQTESTSNRAFISPRIRHVDVDRLVELFQQSSLAQSLQQEIESSKRSSNPSQAESTEGQEDLPVVLPEQFLLKGHDRVGIVGQFFILSNRTFKNLYRNPMLLFTHYVIAILLGVFCGVLYYNVANDISGFQNRLGLFFFLLALFGFSTLTTLNLFAEERIIFVRERANEYYHPLAYYFAKVIFDIFPLRILPPILLGLIVYPLVGLSLDDWAFFKFMLILVLFNLTAASTCLVIGILIRDSGVANLIGVLVMLFSLLFAGLFLNHDSMPAATVWFQYISIFHYAYEALTVNEVKYLTLTEKKFGLSIEVPGATILSTFGFDSGAVKSDMLGLASFFLVFLVAGYVAMHFVLVERR